MKKDTAFLIHVFYEEVFMKVIAPYVEKHIDDVDLYINLVIGNNSGSYIKSVKERFPSAVILFSENPGRDIRGYMNILSYIYEKELKYTNYMFIHTKTQKDASGKNCLKSLLDNTVGSKKTFGNCIKIIQEGSNYGMVGSRDYLTKGFHTKEERTKTLDILRRLGSQEQDATFIAGTMFMIRSSIVDKHLRKCGVIPSFTKDFVENGAKNSGWHHAWERVFGTIVYEEGLEIYPYDFILEKS